MPDTIVDSKFRLLEPLARLSGRPRHLVSNLIRSQVGVLETAPLEGFDRILERWTDHWQPSLRDRAARFASRGSFVPVTAVGAWLEGPYYVYDSGADPARLEQSLDRLPEPGTVVQLLEDLAEANACGECPSCRWFAQDNHPDFRRVIPEADRLDETEAAEEGDKKKGSTQIRIDQIRALEDFVYVGGHRGQRRVRTST